MKNREYKRRFAKAVFKRLVRGAQRNEVLEQLHSTAPRAAYAGLLHYARSRTKPNGQRWSDKWAAAVSFCEIYGDWPRGPDRRVDPEPLPDFLIERWVELRPKRKSGKKAS